jgi:hypothetical protein
MNLEKQVNENTRDIQEIKTSIAVIRDNHLHHIEKDMDKQSKMIEKLDMRIWWILGLLVIGIVIPAFLKGVGL